MCGIAGKLNLDNATPVEEALIVRMMDTISHRGPDGAGRYVSGPVGLGHRRLSIIDLSTGSQPLANEDNTVWIVYNGELYNYPSLREELLARGHRFRTTTDTEVIVHLYEELGEGCVERLRGMFAFALWDQRGRTLLLARDRVGIKPLYYTRTREALLFGSEIKALLADRSVETRINARAIDRFLTYYYLPGTETLFEGIQKLEPGHILTVRNGVTSIRRYWHLAFPEESRRIRFDEAVEALRRLLGERVKDHLLSDVPVGVLLSGGVDSTGVLRYAAEHTAGRISTFTVGFAGEGFADERPYARLAAERYGALHREITVSAADFAEQIPRYVWHMEEPVCEPPAIALYLVSRLAHQSSVKVLLSGEGGDEAFGGYYKYRNVMALEGLKQAFAPGLLKSGMRSLARFGGSRVPRYAQFVDLPLNDYYLSCTSLPDTPFNRMKRELYTAEFSQVLGAHRSDEPTQKLFEQVRGLPVLHQLLHVDTSTWLPDDLLVKADKMTMATSVELRVPLLDHDVLEFAASLPPRFKVRGGTTKRILKAALGDSVPAAILNRKKAGFPVPYGRWLRKELKELVHDTVLDPAAAIAQYFRKDALSRVLQLHQQGEGYSQEVFSLLVLELLHRQFLRERAARLLSPEPMPVRAPATRPADSVRV